MKRIHSQVFLILLSISILVGSVQAKPRRAALRYTLNLPNIDRVELEKFEPHEFSIGRVLATKVLERSEAQLLASLWRRQAYRSSFEADCHEPVYGIKFYSKDRLVVHVSVCWNCDNIEFLEPRLGFRQTFLGKGEAGQMLLEVFKKAFG